MTIDNGSTFTCWKEIAAYLGKGIRTVQRWEREFGLPVKRPNARCKGIVRASREELDEWMKTKWSRRAIADAERIPNLATVRDCSVESNVAKLAELRACNHELVTQFGELLRALRSRCEELRVTVCQNGKTEEQESSVV